MLRNRAATLKTNSVTGAPALSKISLTASQLGCALPHCAAREPKHAAPSSSQTSASPRECHRIAPEPRVQECCAGLRDARVRAEVSLPRVIRCIGALSEGS